MSLSTLKIMGIYHFISIEKLAFLQTHRPLSSIIFEICGKVALCCGGDRDTGESTVRNDTPLEPIVPTRLRTPVEMSTFKIPVHYYADKDLLKDLQDADPDWMQARLEKVIVTAEKNCIL